MFNDDIAAIATAPGEGGIAIIRLSGTKVIDIASNIFEPRFPEVNIKEKKSHTLTLGWIIDKQEEKIDEVLLGIMRAPASYTGEDVVEINCHGGTLPARKCLERVLELDVRLAEPGEFTRRAFLNGRLDASQAEAVIEIIRAKTEKGLKLAMSQLTGKNRQLIDNMEDSLLALNAMVEASMDFPDDVGEPDYNELEKKFKEIIINVDKLLEAGRRADIYREGISIVICGKPNVGKSSLLNALLRKEKAIVSSIPGTTRDIIEDYVNVRGIPLKLMDTAGIRLTDDLVERIGVERAQEVIDNADLIILLLDVGSGITDEDRDIFKKIENKNIIVLVNKEDLEDKKLNEKDLKRLFGKVKIIRASVKEDIGLEDLEESIEKIVLSGKLRTDDLEIMINLRQKKALMQAKKHLEDALNALGEVPLDCLDVDIWGAVEAMGEISGKNLKEEVINRIFQDFCIGK